MNAIIEYRCIEPSEIGELITIPQDFHKYLRPDHVLIAYLIPLMKKNASKIYLFLIA